MQNRAQGLGHALNPAPRGPAGSWPEPAGGAAGGLAPTQHHPPPTGRGCPMLSSGWGRATALSLRGPAAPSWHPDSPRPPAPHMPAPCLSHTLPSSPEHSPRGPGQASVQVPEAKRRLEGRVARRRHRRAPEGSLRASAPVCQPQVSDALCEVFCLHRMNWRAIRLSATWHRLHSLRVKLSREAEGSFLQTRCAPRPLKWCGSPLSALAEASISSGVSSRHGGDVHLVFSNTLPRTGSPVYQLTYVRS